MNMQGNVRAQSVNVGSALVAGPFALGKRPVDKRRPYTRMRGTGLGLAPIRRFPPHLMKNPFANSIERVVNCTAAEKRERRALCLPADVEIEAIAMFIR